MADPTLTLAEEVKRRKCPDIYEGIMKQVGKYLEEFENDESHQTAIDPIEFQEKMSEYQDKIKKELGMAQQKSLTVAREYENISHWVNILNTQQNAFLEDEDESEEVQRFIISFSSNVDQLKGLSTDVVEFLRNLIDNQETPMTIRLSEILKQAHQDLATRRNVLDQVDINLNAATKKLDALTDEHEHLIEQGKTADEQLQRYSASDSYEFVQKAKKCKFIEEQWNDRKRELEEQIQNVQNVAI